MNLRIILLMLFIACLAGCDQSSTREAPYQMKAAAADFGAQRAKNPFLAYEHSVRLEVDVDKLQSAFDQLINACVSNELGRCAVMQSSIRGGDYGYANIQLRLAPQAVQPFMALLGNTGEITEQSTNAEDLTDVIADSSKRLEMLQSYRDRLQQLEQNPDNTIDSLIKIAAELAEVQTRLEFTQGEKAGLYQRVEQDILNISISAKSEESVLSPIGLALDEFVDNLSEATASLIIFTAYFLPWALAIWVLFFLARLSWRRSRKRVSAKKEASVG